jgi:dihydropteroate synthase
MSPTFTWKLTDRTLTIGRRPLLMGIVNVTPDSFSDGGHFFEHEKAVQHGLALVAEGADILDIGGESTRPHATPVTLQDELKRVLPVITELAKQTNVPLSIDTSKAEVAKQALAAGAHIINDITGLEGDSGMVEVARQSGAGVVVMHMQGTPQTMQLDPKYKDVVAEVRQYLQRRLNTLTQQGIASECIALDPGIGFGKKQEHNLALLTGLESYLEMDRPLCLGVSRKGFINRVLGRTGPVELGDAGTVGVLLYALSRGTVQIARVHNVRVAHDAVRLFLALEEAEKM